MSECCPCRLSDDCTPNLELLQHKRQDANSDIVNWIFQKSLLPNLRLSRMGVCILMQIFVDWVSDFLFLFL